MRNILVVVLVGVVIAAGAVAYSFFKPPAEPSGPLQAIPIAQDVGSGLSELWAREGVAVALLDSGTPEDVKEAGEHLKAALALAERFGHLLYVKRVNAHLERIPTSA